MAVNTGAWVHIFEITTLITCKNCAYTNIEHNYTNIANITNIFIQDIDTSVVKTDVIINVCPVILTHPVNFPCGRKPEHPEKTHDFGQSVDYNN